MGSSRSPAGAAFDAPRPFATTSRTFRVMPAPPDVAVRTSDANEIDLSEIFTVGSTIPRHRVNAGSAEMDVITLASQLDHTKARISKRLPYRLD